MRSVIGALVICAATAATAAPITRVDADVDGDGIVDHVSIEDGALVIATKQTTQRIPLATGVTTAHLDATTVTEAGKTTHVIVAVFVAGKGEETAVFQLGGTSWEQVVREVTGGVGLDHDFATVIGAAANGIYRYQARPGLRRCDGKPAYLFAEGWKNKRWNRLSRIPTDVPPAAPVIAARVDNGAAPATPVEYQARVASHEPGAADAGALAIPAELDDGVATTYWHEDFTTSDGEGQFFTFEPRIPGARATQLRIVAGNHTSAAALRKDNRPQRLGIVTAKLAWHVDLPDAANEPLGTAFVADLPAPIEGCVTVVIESTYGSDKGTTAIAELEVYAEGERTGGGEAALAHAVADGKDAKSAAQALARRGAAATQAIDALLATTKDVAARRRLAGTLIEIKDPSAAAPLAKAIAEGLIESGELDAAFAALAQQHVPSELHRLAADTNLAPPIRAGAARALALAIKSDAASALFVAQLSSDAPREVRRAVIDTLSTLPVAALLDALKGQGDAELSAVAAGDLWRAITRRARTVAAERGSALAAMTTALATTTDYERRYRLVDGIAALGDGAALRALADLLSKLPATAERAAFEQVAARAIASTPRPEALELLTTFVRSPDPGVRYAALTALGSAEAGVAGPWHAAANADAIDRVIQTALASDTWPEVRARAAQMLGARCSRTGPARSLADAVGRDPTLVVRGDALAALVECKAGGVAGLLAKLMDNDKQPVELRQRAIDLSVGLGDRALAVTLVGKLAAWRGAALESEAALALAQNAAYAVGRLAPPGAADALLAALEDSAYPEIVAAAATGLGLLGPACPAGAQVKLRLLAHSEEQQIQLAASRAAAQCGK